MLARIFLDPDDVIYQNWVNIKVNARIQRVNQFIYEHKDVLCDTQVLFEVDLFLVGDWNLKIYFEQFVFQVGSQRIKVHLRHLRDSYHRYKVHYHVLNCVLHCREDYRHGLCRNVDKKLHETDRQRNAYPLEFVRVVRDEPNSID